MFDALMNQERIGKGLPKPRIKQNDRLVTRPSISPLDGDSPAISEDEESTASSYSMDSFTLQHIEKLQFSCYSNHKADLCLDESLQLISSDLRKLKKSLKESADSEFAFLIDCCETLTKEACPNYKLTKRVIDGLNSLMNSPSGDCRFRLYLKFILHLANSQQRILQNMRNTTINTESCLLSPTSIIPGCPSEAEGLSDKKYFYSLCLSLKQQFPSSSLDSSAISQLYTRAIEEDIPAEQWRLFICSCLRRQSK